MKSPDAKTYCILDVNRVDKKFIDVSNSRCDNMHHTSAHLHYRREVYQRKCILVVSTVDKKSMDVSNSRCTICTTSVHAHLHYRLEVYKIKRTLFVSRIDEKFTHASNSTCDNMHHICAHFHYTREVCRRKVIALLFVCLFCDMSDSAKPEFPLKPL